MNAKKAIGISFRRENSVWPKSMAQECKKLRGLTVTTPRTDCRHITKNNNNKIIAGAKAERTSGMPSKPALFERQLEARLAEQEKQHRHHVRQLEENWRAVLLQQKLNHQAKLRQLKSVHANSIQQLAESLENQLEAALADVRTHVQYQFGSAVAEITLDSARKLASLNIQHQKLIEELRAENTRLKQVLEEEELRNFELTENLLEEHQAELSSMTAKLRLMTKGNDAHLLGQTHPQTPPPRKSTPAILPIRSLVSPPTPLRTSVKRLSPTSPSIRPRRSYIPILKLALSTRPRPVAKPCCSSQQSSSTCVLERSPDKRAAKPLRESGSSTRTTNNH